MTRNVSINDEPDDDDHDDEPMSLDEMQVALAETSYSLSHAITIACFITGYPPEFFMPWWDADQQQ